MTLADNLQASLSAPDKRDGRRVDAVLARQLRICDGGTLFSDFLSLAVRKLRPMVIFASWHGAVNALVQLVFTDSRPPQMARVNATQMPVSASVGGLVLRSWPLTIGHGADRPVSHASAPSEAHKSVAQSVCAVGPDQAVRSLVLSGLRDKALGATAGLAHIVNGPYSFCSHASNLLRSALVRTRCGVSAPSGFAFCTPFSGGVQ